MLKLARSMLLSRSRNVFSERLLVGKLNSVLEALCVPSQAGISTASNSFSRGGITSPRIFAPYSIYKGKAALSLDPVLPTFSKLDSGFLRVERKGVILLTFWPAIGERKYDWSKRQVFALSATEVGSLISMRDSSEFFHDPSMKSSNAGQVRKSLSVKALPDGSGYFISLNVVNSLARTNEKFVVPVTNAEFAVMKTACNYALPHILGWHRLTNPQGSESAKKSSLIDPQSLDLEWDK